ncbi:MAG: DUF3048 domain-containing protein [Lachnospiraceae bacterium]|nr:DUF3048 domain-containing protein [Lachnospiraceae bacterium]
MNKKRFKLLICATAIVAVILIILTVVIISGKKKKKDDTTTTEASISIETVTPMSETGDFQVISREGYVLSDLTGEWIDESLENKRPVCIMINNIIDAIPQSGIGTADIIYEMKVEGSLTRLLCVFKDYDNITKLGPVRSARHYYVELTHMMDGIYAHYGWSPLAEAEIPALGVNNLNGLYLDGTVYYRDDARYAPHNVYTTGTRLVEGIANAGYSVDYVSQPEKMYAFNYEDTPLGTGNVANVVRTDYAHNSPWFEYNADEAVYYRFQYDRAHIDDQTGEQLTFKNIVVIFVQYTSLDNVDHQDIDWDKGGSGYYATDGEYKSITWKKDNGVLKFFDEDGKQLRMNPGKTFISVFDETYTEGVTFE